METATPYAKIIPGASTTIDVIFTHAFVPAGTFNLEHAGAKQNSKILLNMKDDDCYQRGVHGIADSIEGVAAWLQAKIKDLGGRYVRMIGLSAGGTAAIIFGHLLEADAVIAVAPEIQLGIPGYRSYDWNPEKQYHKRFRDTAPLLRFLGQRLSLVFPAWDMSDYRHIHSAMQDGAARLLLVPDMHSGASQLDWRRILAAQNAVDIAEMTLNGLYDWQFDLEDVWRGVAGFEAIGRADHFVDRMFTSLLQFDPENPGICYRAAMQKALLGEYGQAADLWRRSAPWIASTGFGLAGRFGEYEPLVGPAAFERLKAFVESMADNEPPALVTRKQPSPMAMW
jgi:hypothetical protein